MRLQNYWSGELKVNFGGLGYGIALDTIDLFFRFVKVLLNSKLDKKEIGSHVKTLRIQYLMKNSDLKCQDNFIPQKNILDNLDILSQMIGVESSEVTNRIFSKSDINVAVEMFMNLNACPSFYVRLYWKVIFGPKSRMVMLASNILKKSNDGFKPKALNIFAKISSVLGFQHISYQPDENSEIKLTKNVLKVEGEILHFMLHFIDSISPKSLSPFLDFGDL